METSIQRVMSQRDGKPAWLISGAKITHIGEVRSGISRKTGNEWSIQNINICIDNGTEGRADYLQLTLRKEQISQFAELDAMQVGAKIDVEVSFDISQGNYPTTNVNVLFITKSTQL